MGIPAIILIIILFLVSRTLFYANKCEYQHDDMPSNFYSIIHENKSNTNNNRGNYSNNNDLIDVGGLRESYGNQALSSGINLRSDSFGSYGLGGYGEDNGIFDESANYANMTSMPASSYMPMSNPSNNKAPMSDQFILNTRMRPDPNYLEDVMETNYYSSCKPNMSNGSQSDRVCDKTILVGSKGTQEIFDNPTNGYQRTWGGTQITLNNNINDPMFSQINYNPSDNSIVVPYSATFNRLP